jgi:guanine deaminase
MNPSEPNLSRRTWMATTAKLALPGIAMATLTSKGLAAEAKTTSEADKKRSEHFMRRAIELAQKGVAAGDGGPFGAIVVKGNDIVGEGWNHVVSHNDPTAHGEVLAIRDAGHRLKKYDLKGCELYSTGEPCPMCLCATYWARIDRLFYGFSIAQAETVGFDDAPFFREMNKPIHERKVAEIQILGDDAFAMLKAFANNPNRVKY